LSGPEECLASFLPRDDLRLWDVESGDFVAVSVLNVVPNVGDFDVCLDVKAAQVFMVNSPSRAAVKKVVVRHAKTAASSGCDRLSWARTATISSMRSGRRLGSLSASGVDFLAPLSMV
jgi:hypothetical protein